VTDVRSTLTTQLVERGLERREANWLIDEFAPGLDPDFFPVLDGAVVRRLAGEPLQYIIGHWPFRSLDLDVDPRVLIPRPETEELVAHALLALSRTNDVSPLIGDLGCGSGAIGLALLVELAERGVAATLVGVDESQDALAVAKRNALKHALSAASFVQSSWLSQVDESLRGRFSLIVANPPYVGSEEYRELDPVLRYEPRGALVAEDAHDTPGLADLVEIISTARAWLRPGAYLLCEHGYQQGDATRACALAAGFLEVETVADMAGHPRFLVARNPAC